MSFHISMRNICGLRCLSIVGSMSEKNNQYKARKTYLIVRGVDLTWSKTIKQKQNLRRQKNMLYIFLLSINIFHMNVFQPYITVLSFPINILTITNYESIRMIFICKRCFPACGFRRLNLRYPGVAYLRPHFPAYDPIFPRISFSD